MADLIRIQNSAVTVEIAPLGAEMQSITTADGKAWLWHGDAAFWGGRAPVLFPIVGRAAGDVLAIDGKDYPMGQHGFARRSVFALEASGADFALFALVADDKSRAVYPFDFKLTIEYRIAGSAVTVTSTVTNTGTAPMPFQLGYHPAFNWPLPGGEGRTHQVWLDNKGQPKLARLQGGLLRDEGMTSPFVKGQLVPEPAMFDADAMLFLADAGEGLVFGVEGGPSIRFAFSDLPNLALWTKPGAPFLCVEPWHGTAARLGAGGELSARPFAMSLEPGASRPFAYSAEFLA